MILAVLLSCGNFKDSYFNLGSFTETGPLNDEGVAKRLSHIIHDF